MGRRIIQTLISVPLFIFLGLQHQGIFRVSGSQVEVNDIKNSFERGVCVCVVTEFRFLNSSESAVTAE